MKRNGEGERDNGIIYFDVNAIFVFGGRGFIGSGGDLGSVAFAGRHVECEDKGEQDNERRMGIFCN